MQGIRGVSAYTAAGLILCVAALAGPSGPVHAQPTPIQHVVVIMMENHSLDNYFGDFPGVAGTKWGVKEPPAPNPLPQDLDHTGPRTIAAIDGGKMDDFNPRGEVQYRHSDIPTYWAYAKQYGLGVNFFADAETSSTPNHIAMVAAQTGGDFFTTTHTGCDSPLNVVVNNRDVNGNETFGQPCYDISSLPTEMTNAGLTWKMYGGGDIWNPLVYIKNLSGTPSIDPLQIVTDAKAGNLPAVSFVAPDGAGGSDHPAQLIQPAENFVASIVNGIMKSPEWSSTAIFVTWDEFGGFYDHIPPPQVDGRGMGLRVPLLVISPYAKRGFISVSQGEFASFDKFIEANFGLPSLGARDALSQTSDLMNFFDFSGTPPNKKLIEPMRKYSQVLQPLSTSLAARAAGGGGPSLFPQYGDSKTSFTYSVVYNNKAAPTVHNVVVDGQPIVMTAVKTVGRDHVIYRARTTLARGTHTYSFQFSDGATNWKMPVNNVQYTGPVVGPFNLTHLSAGRGGSFICQTGKPCTFSVKYAAPGGHKPTVANVVIDGISYPMTAGTGNAATSGRTYRYTTSALPTGSHYIQLEFNNGSGLQNVQEREMVVTPIVLPDAKVSPASGSTSTVFTFSTIYRGPDSPGYVDVVIDGVAYPLTYVSGSPASGATYSTAMSLPAGSHTFAFTAADSVNAWSNPQSPAVYTGLMVAAAGQPVPHSRITAPPLADNPDSYDPN